ncbi:MAG: pitrilysin family protein [Candidatus Omnitrophota bacterium]
MKKNLHTLKTLPNGLKLVASRMPYMESVSIGVWVALGGRYEEKRSCGISHFIEHMLFKGTLSRDARQLKQAIEGVGGHINAFTSEENTCYLVKVPSRHMALAMDILSDMVKNPKMDAVEIERERNVILEEIKMYKDQPASYVHELLAQTMWPDHPLGRPLTGEEETVMGLDRTALAGVRQRYYQPSGMSVVAAGCLEEDGFFKLCDKNLGECAGAEILPFAGFRSGQKEPAVKLYYKDTEQINLAMGFHVFGRKDKRRHALGLLNIILGGNMSSRLFEELREKRGLCYDVASSVKLYDETGAFFLHAGVDNGKVEETLAAVMNELSMISAHGISPDELARAKEFAGGQFSMALEDTGTRMLWLGEKITNEAKIPEVNSVLRDIGAVKEDDVGALARYVFRTSALNVALIGGKQYLKEGRIRKVVGKA